MPVIARFYGILIKMYFKEHGTPHFHAIYGEYIGVFDVTTLDMIEGDLPNRAQRMVREWAQRYRSDLLEMWATQAFKPLPGLDCGRAMKGCPKVESVSAVGGRRLLVTFENGVRKLYDCTGLVQTEVFAALHEDWLFRSVRADAGGYGISWNDDLDLSESELWENGCLVEGLVQA